MKKICLKCGTEIGDAKFCPNCGTKSNYNSTAYHSHNFKLSRYIPMFFPVMYIILILLKWFRLEIPLLGEREFNLYNLYGGLDDLFSYSDGIVAEFISKTFAVIFIILSIIIAYLSIKACVRILKGNDDIASFISSASIAAIFESILVILSVIILKAVIKNEFSDSELGYLGVELGKAVSNILSFTGAPIALLIFGIIGKIVSNKLIYINWKNGLKENDILSGIEGDENR